MLFYSKMTKCFAQRFLGFGMAGARFPIHRHRKAVAKTRLRPLTPKIKEERIDILNETWRMGFGGVY